MSPRLEVRKFCRLILILMLMWMLMLMLMLMLILTLVCLLTCISSRIKDQKSLILEWVWVMRDIGTIWVLKVGRFGILEPQIVALLSVLAVCFHSLLSI